MGIHTNVFFYFFFLQDWLDFKRVSDKEALDTIRPPKEWQWHRVSNLVNNSRNKSCDCNVPLERLKEQQTANQKPNMLQSWLKKKPKLDTDDNDESTKSK